MIYGWKNEGGDGKQLAGDFINVRQQVLVESECDYFTSRDYMPVTLEGWRPRGKYVSGTTTATLDYTDHSMRRYQLDIRFANLDDASKLRDLIMAGKIWPDVCYEDKQVPAPCRHLKDLFREAIGIIRREVTKKMHFAS